MATRRPHTKSRLGCLRCKQKHTKCDEARPTCGTCARYNVPCVLRSAKPAPARQALSGRSTPGSVSVPSSSIAATPDPGGGQSRSMLSLWEFELLHHWILHVATSFAVSPGFDYAWRDQAVQAAMQHDFFLHMILILSALHLGLTNSPKFTEVHRTFILHGCSEAMSGFQKEAANIDNLNWESVQAVQAFPFLVSIYVLALAQFDRAERNKDTVLDETVHILLLIKGNAVIQRTAELSGKGKELDGAREKTRWVREDDILAEPEGYAGDTDLVDTVKGIQLLVDASDDSEAVRATNTHAVRVFTEAMSLNLKLNLRPLAWPNLIQDDFLELLRLRNPIALVILAHYAVILGQCSSQWWCGNWGVRMVEVIASCLPDGYTAAMSYPLQALGLN